MLMIRRPLTLLLAAFLLALLVPFSAVAGASQVTLEGRLALAHGDDFSADEPHAHAPGQAEHSHGRSLLDYSLVTADGSTYRIAFASGKGPDNFLNGATVRVKGALSGGTLAVGTDPTASQVTSAAVAAATTTKKLAILLVNFTTNTAQPWTVGGAQGTVFTNTNSVANYFLEESDGQFAVTGDVFGYFTINFDTTTCNYTDLATKAKNAAAAALIDLATYTNIQYAFPSLSSCGWAGLAYLPGKESWINNALNLRVSGHELSHNFGVHHASTLNCTVGGVRVSLSANAANCTASEYGDPFTIMGSASTRHTHNQQLATFGWLPTSQRLTVTSGGTFLLGAAEDASAAVRALRVTRGNGTYLYLELRRPTGTSFDNFSATDPAVTGIGIRISNDWSTIIQSKLIDTTPATTSFSDAPLAVGATFSDPVSGASIHTISVDSSGATVEIGWGPDTFPPTTPTGLTATLSSPTTGRLSWGASTDNLAVTGYRVSRGGVVLGTVSATTYDDTGLAPATYGYAVEALDGAGNASPAATVSLVVPVPDTTAPTNPTNLRVTSVTKSKVTLAWNAATDAVGVAGYRIYRGAVLVATVTTLSWTENRQRSASTYTVVAFDAAGNVSGVSNAVTVAAR